MATHFNFGQYSIINNENVDDENTQINSTSVTFRYPCTNKQNCSGFEIKLKVGHYLFEVFGAQGSQDSGSQKGGLGGYGSAEITITKTIPLYLFIGSQGKWTDDGQSEASFNGGGCGFKLGPGGGGTDFRMSENDLGTRFLIAGGGGAQGGYFKSEVPDYIDSKKLHEYVELQGGFGGGEKGRKGGETDIEGGTQLGGGHGYLNGSFGSGCEFHRIGIHGGSGGGLFDGGCGEKDGASGAGGSGFFYSENRPSEISEIKDIEISNGNLAEGKNSGDGYAIITLLSASSNDYVKRHGFSPFSVLTCILKHL
ncbi:hypothetical protein TVAG_034220 [Trichomonas vaginalis G3]|uniref:receptor protein-tyrosine kinase n=1 Tax=Trichomonas vaginalis (strain ATCC PRA-98 / G3) TaxID=412133 RepID=A2EM59_TRIV3|nr:glycine-rich protein family [Trichomonas vaginalis G3]EAY06243.1 hypothetical protein TVAG_034220 [Trichomonas vaginalis G3]KAI5505176.1 glycine-rich protein family [Trichomonas vaginalis G3]|eukprot:XP_001318466.1 hypothetical protein [Trichomonas vaginalis G3]